VVLPALNREIVERAARLLFNVEWRVWYFGDNAGFWGLEAASTLTGDDSYTCFAYGLAKAWCARRTPQRKYDQTLPGLECLELARRFSDAQLVEAVIGHAEWLSAHERVEGAWLTDDDYPRLIWVDTLSIHPPFLAALGEYKREYYDVACELLLNHARLLQDDAGLFCHTYNVDTQTTDGVHWGRGQGWALMGLLETWKRLPDGFSGRDEIASRFRRCLEALEALQTPEGSWHTVVDDPESYTESSTAAFYVIAASQAITHGLIPRKHYTYIKRAWRAVENSFSGDGRYLGVSEDTWSGDKQYYRSVPKRSFSTWSQGAALAAIKEYIALRGLLNGSGKALGE
jgi:Predicted unsaturated glucuronyl hydrolase involved in regulation of bacterial surface properties, and related proteins